MDSLHNEEESIPQDEFPRRSCEVQVPAIGRVPAGTDLPNYTVERAQAMDGTLFLLYRDPYGNPLGSRMTALAVSGQLDLPKAQYEQMSARIFERMQHDKYLNESFRLGSKLAAARTPTRNPKPYTKLLADLFKVCSNDCSISMQDDMDDMDNMDDDFDIYTEDPNCVGERLIVLDLFCGLGGLSLGLKSSGFHHCAGVDCWKTAVSAYISNKCGSWGLLRKIRAQHVHQWVGAIRRAFDTKEHGREHTGDSFLPLVLVGGPPCQPFSKRGIRMGCADEREGLSTFLTLVAQVKPVAFVIENVPELVQNKTFNEWLQSQLHIVDDQYRIKISMHDCTQHRIPQQRKRVSILGFCIAAQGDQTFDHEVPTHSTTYVPWDAWCDESTSFWQGPTPSELRLETITLRSRQRIQTPTQTSGLVVANQPANTILTSCMSGNSWHRLVCVPLIDEDDFEADENHVEYGSLRALLPRHIKLLQSFPPDFVLYGSYRAQGHMLGNAVPPMLAYDIGCYLISCLQAVQFARIDIQQVMSRLYTEIETCT